MPKNVQTTAQMHSSNTLEESEKVGLKLKFRKLSSGHRTGKGQFSFQSQRKTMPKNVQTIAQLHSFHMISK